MNRSFILGLCCLLMLTATLAAPNAQAQSSTGLRLISEFTIPGSRDVKFPHVDAQNGFAHVSGNANRSDALYWNKRDRQTSISDPFRIGVASGQPDFSTTAITVAPNGEVYYVWINQPDKSIFLRKRDTAGNWGPQRTVVGSSPFPVAVEVGVASNGTIFVVWRDPDRPAKYRTSSNQGVDWTPTTDLGNVAFASPLDIATGPNGRVSVTWTAGEGDRLQVFVGIWNGGGFDVRRVTTLGTDYADSSVTIGPDGRYYVAWRGVEDGVFFSERQPDGSWPRSRLASGKITGTVSVNADEQGNLHFNWIAQPSGGNLLYYAFRTAAGRSIGPIASGNRGSIFNSTSAASVSDAIYAHSVTEEFTGSGLRSRYSLWQGEGNVFGAEPVVEGGATVISRRSTVALTFRGQQGTIIASDVRWRWNGPPTDTSNDSGGWKPFASTIAVPVPQSVLDDTSCKTTTFYTQLRNAQAGLIEPTARSVTFLFDGVVEGTATVRNPFTPSSAALPPDIASVAGAPIGDPRYTRVPLITLDVTSQDDCTDLKSVGVGKNADSIETNYLIDESGFSGVVPMPDFGNLRDGPVPVTVQLRDGAGNRRDFTFTMIFDEGKPVLDTGNPGDIVPSANPRGDIMQNLSFQNINVSDITYGGRGFWGVWIANSRDPVANPATSDDLTWTALRAPGSGRSFTISDWSLATGLAAGEVTPGTYYVYVRFLDGAGNPTDSAISVTLTSNVERPGTYLPLVRR